jgi:hypothetical protein
MECVSTWPLLQRNKIEDSKINIAVQAIADAAIQQDEVTVAGAPVKCEETPKPPELKPEPSELASPGSTQPNPDQPPSLIKSENAESADLPVSVDSTNGVTPMAVDEQTLESGRGRISERHESQTMKLKRLATKVIVFQSTPLQC